MREQKSKREMERNWGFVRWLTCGQRGYVHWSVGQKKRALAWGASEWVYLRFRIPVHSHQELFHHLTPQDLELPSPIACGRSMKCTEHYRGQRPINVLQEVDTDLISQWMIISGLTSHWFVQGPKVAVVVVSVFNTLNTIDCREGGIFLNDARIRLDSERF